MAIYGRDTLYESAGGVSDDAVTLSEQELNEYVQLIAFDDMRRLPEMEIQGMMESGELEALCEKQVLNKKTMMRLSKGDDKKRRIKLIAYKLAKDEGNPHWKKMMMWRDKWKSERDEILKKHGKRAEKIATMAQKEYIKKARKTK